MKAYSLSPGSNSETSRSDRLVTVNTSMYHFMQVNVSSIGISARDSETLLTFLHQPAAAEWHSQSFKGKKEEKGEDKSLL